MWAGCVEVSLRYCGSIVEDVNHAAGFIGCYGVVPTKIGCSTKVEPAMGGAL